MLCSFATVDSANAVWSCFSQTLYAKKGVMLGGVKFTPIFPVISFPLKVGMLLKRAIMPKGCLSV
jgi:hypothetical protein